ncbi:hypothetical protein KI387_001920 [Taxus chinensis]|uniref:Uncharacterized protein n=1 Tax=Taxus chinensis TaxID=29808 RepID=A0AA38LQH0_TAXCH|nr:hypothetical protein KI387_001920 [Taxus chinensis]
MDIVYKEGLEGRGFSSPHDKFLRFNSHTHAVKKSDLHFERDGAMQDEDLALNPIIVPDSHHYELIINHYLVNTDKISTCDESRVEKEAKEMVRTHFSKRHDNSQLAGLLMTTALKSQVESIHDLGKNHKEAPCICQQSMDEVEVEKEDGQAEDSRRYDIGNHISVFWSPPMSLPYLCHHGQHRGNDDKVKSTQSGKEFIDPLSYKEGEVFNGFHVTMAGECFISCRWLERNSMRNLMELVVHSNFLVKDEMLQDGLIVPCTTRFLPLKLTLEKPIVSHDFYVVGMESTDLTFEIQWLHPFGEFTQNYQARELRFKLGDQKVVLQGMTSGDTQVATAKRMEIITRRRQDLWVTFGKIIATLSVLKQQRYRRDFHLLIHVHTPSLPRKVNVDFINITFGSEQDRCYLVALCIITQLEIGGTNVSINHILWDSRHAVIKIHTAVINIFSLLNIAFVAIQAAPTIHE